jgi:hypothetical protein
MENLGIFYGHLVYFMSNWYFLWLFWIFCGLFRIFSPVLVCCAKKNLATLLRSLTIEAGKQARSWQGSKEWGSISGGKHFRSNRRKFQTPEKTGTDVMILNICLRKTWRKLGVFVYKTRNFRTICIGAMVFMKNIFLDFEKTLQTTSTLALYVHSCKFRSRRLGSWKIICHLNWSR